MCSALEISWLLSSTGTKGRSETNRNPACADHKRLNPKRRQRNRREWWAWNIINMCKIWCRLDLVSWDKPAQTWALGDGRFCLRLRGDSWCSPSRRTPARNKRYTKLHSLTTMHCASPASTYFVVRVTIYLDIFNKQYHAWFSQNLITFLF